MPINDVQTTNKQHAVPQNIMDVEFKIIGELTMRQFAYLMVGGGLAFASATYVGGFFKWPFALFFVILALSFAFVPIEDRGLDQWVVAFFRAVYTPTQKVWKKEVTVPSVFSYQNLDVVKKELITLAPTSSRRKLEEYLDHQHDTGPVDRLDIDEGTYISKIKEAYSTTPSYTVPTATVDLDTQPFFSSAVSSAPQKPVAPQAPIEPQKPSEPVKETKEAQVTPTTAPPLATPATPVAPVAAAPVASVPTVMPAPQVSLQTVAQPTASQPQPAVKVDTVNKPLYKKPTDDIKPVKKKVVDEGFKFVDRSNRQAIELTRGDRHTGRKFTNLLANQGEIVLPIRGERILKTNEEIDIEQDIDEKTSQLKSLIEKIKKEEKIKVSPSSGSTPNSTVKVPDTTRQVKVEIGTSDQLNQADFDVEANAVIETVKEQNKKLQSELDKLKNQMSVAPAESATTTAPDYQSKLKDLETSKQKTETEYSALQKQLHELQERMQEKENLSVQAPQPVKHTAAVSEKVPVASDKPNVLSGVVVDSKDKALEGIVLIVKNHKGESVRATKTNALGQFSLISPLSNGMYTVEVGQYNKITEVFDIISVEVKGALVAPIVFKGRQ